ncbi:hypothetical protein EDD85DRAFT_786040 [Armillaria nabsnona]|nr:hypothetical protein EDD85DRAFT_786040 [Armillaria nabsnona]
MFLRIAQLYSVCALSSSELCCDTYQLSVLGSLWSDSGNSRRRAVVNSDCHKRYEYRRIRASKPITSEYIHVQPGTSANSTLVKNGHVKFKAESIGDGQTDVLHMGTKHPAPGLLPTAAKRPKTSEFNSSHHGCFPHNHYGRPKRDLATYPAPSTINRLDTRPKDSTFDLKCRSAFTVIGRTSESGYSGVNVLLIGRAGLELRRALSTPGNASSSYDGSIHLFWKTFLGKSKRLAEGIQRTAEKRRDASSVRKKVSVHFHYQAYAEEISFIQMRFEGFRVYTEGRAVADWRRDGGAEEYRGVKRQRIMEGLRSE